MFLIENGVDISKPFRGIDTPLYYACEHENESLVKILIELGTGC